MRMSEQYASRCTSYCSRHTQTEHSQKATERHPPDDYTAIFCTSPSSSARCCDRRRTVSRRSASHDARNEMSEKDDGKERSLVLLDRRRLAKLRRGRPVQVEADLPHARPVEHLALLYLVLRLRRRQLVQVEVRRDPRCAPAPISACDAPRERSSERSTHRIARPVYSQLRSSSHRRAGTA